MIFFSRIKRFFSFWLQEFRPLNQTIFNTKPATVPTENKGRVVAKTLSGPDIDFMYYNHFKKPGLCPICHNLIKMIPDMNYKVKGARGRDILCTNDDFDIVSQKFKDFCDERHYEGLTFLQFPKSPNYYYFRPNLIYPIDYQRTQPIFTNKRDCCGQYDEVLTGINYKEKNFTPPSDDFIYRSYDMYGYKFRKSPLIIIGLTTYKEMKKAKLKGLCFKDVYE